MSNQLATIDNNTNFDDIAKFTGQDNQGGGPSLPRLSVNRDYENDDGEPLKPGTFTIVYEGRPIYMNSVKFRSFINAYQYSHWDQPTEKYINKTIIFKNFRDEAIDELGGIRCGKIAKANVATLSAAQMEAQKAVKTFRLVYGTVTADAVDSKGVAVNLKDFPVMFRMRGVNFMPIGEVFDLFTKQKKPIFQHELTITTSKNKKGDTVYWTFNYVPDFKNTRNLTADDIQLLKDFQEVIEVENKAVREKHDAAVRGHSFTAEAEQVVSSLADDFNDNVTDV